jgi:hypothetical protein
MAFRLPLRVNKSWSNIFTLVCPEDIPELKDIISEDLAFSLAAKRDKDSLRDVFTRLMESPNDVVAAKLDQLLTRLGTLSKC